MTGAKETLDLFNELSADGAIRMVDRGDEDVVV
jgi:hypothetical protein